jgi:hypothetical protein
MENIEQPVHSIHSPQAHCIDSKVQQVALASSRTLGELIQCSNGRFIVTGLLDTDDTVNLKEGGERGTEKTVIE